MRILPQKRSWSALASSDSLMSANSSFILNEGGGTVRVYRWYVRFLLGLGCPA